MANETSKTEYLKRYLENDKNSGRKRKKKSKPDRPKANVSRLKIINEDIDLKSINFGDKIEEDDGDEAPVVAEVIDERPIEEKLKELYESSRWKKINTEEVSQSSSAAISGNSDFKSGGESFKELVRHDSDSDTSLPKNQEGNHRKRHDSSNDASPQKRLRKHSDDDISPPRSHKQNKYNTKNNSDSDISPPRSHSSTKPTSQLKNKSKREDSDSDISPPRSHSSTKPTSQLKNKSKREDSDSDISPPRYKNRKKLSPVKHPSKKHNSVNHISSPHQEFEKKSKEFSYKRHDPARDISPHHHHQTQRKRYDSDSDEKHSNHSSRMLKSNRNRNQRNSDSDMSPPRSSTDLFNVKGKDKKLGKTLSGLKAGLRNSATLQEEQQELKKREKMELYMLNDEISGRNADTIIRDRKTGMKRNLEKEQEAKAEENKRNKEYEQKYNKWGKGIEQAEENLDKFKDDLYEMSKPLARYRDDEDLDERLKSIIHDDDPMSEYMKKKRKKDAPNVPVYSGPPAPPNRFGISPGYRWDGVDRSNGFEKKYFEKINTTKAVQDEAYLWSVQDM